MKLESKFIAKEYDLKLIISEHELTDTNVILNKLNNAGWKLGTGHEEIEIKKISDTEYKLLLTPYIGHISNTIYFEKVK